MAKRSRTDIRRRVHSRIRKKVQGTTERPRLAVFRSVKHIYAQVIDDVKGETLAAAASTEGTFKGQGGNVDSAKAIGKAIAERTLKAGIENVVYDRGGYVYHGRVKALLDATREAGLNKTDSDDAKGGKKEKAKPKAEKKAAKPKKESKAKKEKPKAEKKEAPKEDKKKKSADEKPAESKKGSKAEEEKE